MTTQEKSVSMTPAAADKARQMLANRGTPEAYIRVGVTTSGCSGMSYKLEFSDSVEEGDQLFEVGEGIRIVVDPKALIYVVGTQVDYVSNKFKSGFAFTNPNEKSRCGCGESFSV